MKDVTGKEIKEGDFLLEIYNNKYVYLYIANGGVTKSGKFLRVLMIDLIGFTDNKKVQSKSVIIVSKEQLIEAFQHRCRYYNCTDEQTEMRTNNLVLQTLEKYGR